MMHSVGSNKLTDKQRQCFSQLFDLVRCKTERPNAEHIANLYVADFLKTSGLSDPTLARVWSTCMRSTATEVKRKNFYEAMAMVAAEQGKPLPAFEGVNTPVVALAEVQQDFWLPQPHEVQLHITRYKELVQNPGDLLPRDTVVKIMRGFQNLGVPQLKKIWDLIDVSPGKDFTFGQYLLVQVLCTKVNAGAEVPESIPTCLQGYVPMQTDAQSLVLTP